MGIDGSNPGYIYLLTQLNLERTGRVDERHDDAAKSNRFRHLTRHV